MPVADLLLSGLVIASLPLCFMRPWIGVLVFAWLGYMNPHRLLGGLAYDMPFAKLVAVATLLGLVRTKDRAALPRTWEVYLLIALWVTFLCSTLFTALHPEIARQKFAEVSKILLMTGVTLVLFQERRKLRLLLLVIALSIGFFGLTGGVWGLLTRWPRILWGPPGSAIADNNALGFALTMVLPLFAFLRDEEPRWWVRQTLLGLFGLSVVAVYATYSRGGLIVLFVVLGVLALKRRTQDLALLAMITVTLAAVGLAPAQWMERMRTITPQAYRVDPSGQQRMASWYVAFRLGLDHPVLGAGFRPFDPEVYARYIPGYLDNHDAHNHFLQLLAEHGFTAVILFCALLAGVFRSVRRVQRATRGDPERRWMSHYADIVEVSLIAYLVGGAFLNMPYFDLLYQLIAVAIILEQGVRAGCDEATLAPSRTDPRSAPSPMEGTAALPAMRVVVLSRVFPNALRPTYGVFVEERVRRIAARCQVMVVAPLPWFPFNRLLRGESTARTPTHDEGHGLIVHHPRALSPPRWGKCLDGVLYATSLLPSFVRLRRRFRFDLIDAHFAYPDGVAAVMLGKALGCPVVVTLRGDESRLVGFALRRMQIRWALRSAHVIAVSDSLQHLACDLGVPADRVRVIPNGVDRTLFHPSDQRGARARLGLPRDRTVILSVGSLTETKGHHRILQILPELIARCHQLLFVIVGSDAGGEGWRRRIENQVQREQLEQHVRIARERPHEEIPIWMAAADLFCLATQREGCCNAIIEALACGLPVVTTRVGGNPQLVRDGTDGFVVPFWDAAAFRTAILEALSRDWDRAAIAARGNRRQWDEVAGAVLEEFRTALWPRP